jgi:hypothetical protein
MGGVAHREDRSRSWEEPDPPLTRTPTSPTSSSSSTSRRRPRLLPRRRAAPPLYTDACTTTRGHRGEDDRLPPHVDAPAFEPRWNVSSLRAAAGDAGLRARLGKPVCRCRCLHQRAPLSLPSLPLSLLSVVRCHSRPWRRAEPITFAFALAFARVASQTRHPRHRAPQHACASNLGARLDLGPYPLA